MRNTVILLLSLTVMVIMSNASKIITYDGECDYDCSGWPYKQCKVTLTYKNGAWKRAGCTSPYYSRSSYRMQSNYPSCTRLSQTVGSECDRCDDVCSQRDGLDKNDYTETGPKYPVAYDPPTPQLHLLIPRTVLRSKKDVFVVLITENALDGPDPTPWKRAKFTSCEYSDGHLQCDFTNACSEIGYSMVCCEDGGDCKGYTGPHPSDKWCS